MDDYISKPVKMKGLYEVMSRVFGCKLVERKGVFDKDRALKHAGSNNPELLKRIIKIFSS